MTDQPRQFGGGRRAIGDIAPKLAALTDDVLFDDVWNRPKLSARDRSLITVTALIAGGHPDSRTTSAEPSETVSPAPTWSKPSPNLAFYAGWPAAMSAATIAREVFDTTETDAR